MPTLSDLPEELLQYVTSHLIPPEPLPVNPAFTQYVQGALYGWRRGEYSAYHRYPTIDPAAAEFLQLRQVCKALDKHLYEKFVAYAEYRLLRRAGILEISYSNRGLRGFKAILRFDSIRELLRDQVKELTISADQPNAFRLSIFEKAAAEVKSINDFFLCGALLPKDFNRMAFDKKEAMTKSEYPPYCKEYNDYMSMVHVHEDIQIFEQLLGLLSSLKSITIRDGTNELAFKDALKEDFVNSFHPFRKVLSRVYHRWNRDYDERNDGMPDVLHLPGLPVQRVETAALSRVAKAVMNGIAKSDISLQHLSILAPDSQLHRQHTGAATLWSMDVPTTPPSLFANLTHLHLYISDNKLMEEFEYQPGLYTAGGSPLLNMLKATQHLTALELMASSFTVFPPNVLQRIFLEYTSPVLEHFVLEDWVISGTHELMSFLQRHKHTLLFVRMHSLYLCKNGSAEMAWQPIIHTIQYELLLPNAEISSLFELDRDTYDVVTFNRPKLEDEDEDEDEYNEQEDTGADWPAAYDEVVMSVDDFNHDNLHFCNKGRRLTWSDNGTEWRYMNYFPVAITYRIKTARYGEPSMIENLLPTKISGFAEQYLGRQRPPPFTNSVADPNGWTFEDIEVNTKWEEIWEGCDPDVYKSANMPW